MKAIAAVLLAAALVASSCAHVQPVVNDAIVCSGKTIPANLVQEVYTDVMSENWVDLGANVVPILAAGWSDVVCIYNALRTGHPEMAPHIQRLEAGHVELRVTLAPRCSRSAIAWMPASDITQQAEACDALCGAGLGLALSGWRCECWDRSAASGRGSWRFPPPGDFGPGRAGGGG